MYLYGNEEKMENEASDKKKDIKRGVQDGIPIALGYLSVSFAFGIMAVSAGHELGGEISAFQIIPKLFYPGMLFVSSLIFIFVIPQKTGK